MPRGEGHCDLMGWGCHRFQTPCDGGGHRFHIPFDMGDHRFPANHLSVALPLVIIKGHIPPSQTYQVYCMDRWRILLGTIPESFREIFRTYSFGCACSNGITLSICLTRWDMHFKDSPLTASADVASRQL